jgi:DNA repair protein SbcC/Rad50
VKPFSIELKHFGPYTSHTIDLAPFSNEGIFLIHGDTGAGKSTVLDAIAWALYGRALGARDRDDHLRNTSAPADEATTVVLIFSRGEKTYRVRRVMAYERPAKRGGGVTQQRPEALIECLVGDPSYEPVSSPRKVDAEVERILGLSFDQFTRLIVLPQGDFRSLLLAKADDRERLLEQLFGTELYKAIEVELKDTANALEKQVGSSRNRLDAALASVGVSNIAELEALLARTVEQHAEAERSAQQLQKFVSQNDEKLAECRAASKRNHERRILRAEATVLASQSTVLQHNEAQLLRAERASVCEDFYQRLTEAHEQVRSTTRTYEEAHDALKESQRFLADPSRAPARLRSLRDDREVARERRTRFEHLLRERSDLESNQQQLRESVAQRENATTKNRALDEQIAQKKASQSEHRLAIDEAKKVASRESAAVLRIEEVERRMQASRTRQELGLRIREAARLVKAAERKTSQCSENVAEAKTLRDQLRTHERSQLAAQLALTLRVGEACIVCGSHDHPQPAPMSPAEQRHTLAEVEETYETLRTQLVRAEKELATLQGEHQTLSDQVLRMRDEDTATDEQLEEARREASKGLDEIRQSKRKAEESERLLVVMAGDEQRLANERSKIEHLIAGFVATETQLSPRIEAALQRLTTEGTNLATLQSTYDEAAESERVLSTALESLEREIVNAQSQHARCEGKYSTASDTRERAESDLQTREHLWLQNLAAQGFETQTAWKESLLTTPQRLQLRQHVEAARADFLRVAQRLNALGEDEPESDIVESERHATETRDTLSALLREEGDLAGRTRRYEEVVAQTREWSAQYGDVEERWAAVRRVSDAVNGKHEGKTRLSRYVLLEQFDRVTACASARLQTMSDGRFRLRRKESKHMGGEFDLVIDDAYAGSIERSVATLSGGEMFMASLAMALGLSDVVQAWAGGVRVDSLFVDEGFGSLDEDALDKAVSVLEQLGENQRMVGVVSHVVELRKRIPARLEVVRTEGGAATRTTLRGRGFTKGLT